MCLRVHDLESERRRAAQEPLVPSNSEPRLSRPRLVGATAAALVALLVVAALVFPSSTTAVSSAAPMAATPAMAEQTAAAIDDRVPSGTDVARGEKGSAAGRCQHDL